MMRIANQLLIEVAPRTILSIIRITKAVGSYLTIVDTFKSYCIKRKVFVAFQMN